MFRFLRLTIFATLILSVVSFSISAACIPTGRPGSIINVPIGELKTIKLDDQTNVDNKFQSTIRQKLSLLPNASPTEAQMNELMVWLYERARQTCRQYPLDGFRLFVYRSPEDVSGMDWIARIESTANGPKVDIRRYNLRQTQTTMNACNPGKEPGKSIIWPDEITLPEVSKWKVIGTWAYSADLTITLGEASGTTFVVKLSKYCSSSSRGEPVSRSGTKYVLKGHERGKYYAVRPNGDLAAYDSEGYIETYYKQKGLWPQ